MARRKKSRSRLSRYRVIPDSESRVLIDRLSTTCNLTGPDTASCTYRYYDSFDGRLHRAGYELRLESVSGNHTLQLYDARTHDCIHSCEVENAASFDGDLPGGTLRSKLVKLTYPRALLPLVDVTFRLQKFLCHNNGDRNNGDRNNSDRDNRDSPVALLAVQEVAIATDPVTRHWVPLDSFVEIAPLRQPSNGYQELTASLQEQEDLLDETRSSLLQEAAYAIGKTLSYRFAEFNVALDPEMRADEAAKKIGLHLLQTMQWNLPGMIGDLDSEFLHDFRVALRRTRTLLGQLKPLFPPEIHEHFRAEFKWLGQVTGPARDMDVYVLSFEDDRSWLPPAMRGDLSALRDFLVYKKSQTHADLVVEIKTPRYNRLVSEWEQYLLSPPADPPFSEKAALPVIEVARRRIWKAYRRVVREGRVIMNNPDIPEEALHRLRISCKKLRYLIEMFASMFPEKTIKGILKALKRLQNNLGDFHDYQVQQEKLHTFAMLMMESDGGDADTYLAMGRLEAHLASLQQATRSAFESCFERFMKKKNRKKFEKLYRDY